MFGMRAGNGGPHWGPNDQASDMRSMKANQGNHGPIQSWHESPHPSFPRAIQPCHARHFLWNGSSFDGQISRKCAGEVEPPAARTGADVLTGITQVETRTFARTAKASYRDREFGAVKDPRIRHPKRLGGNGLKAVSDTSIDGARRLSRCCLSGQRPIRTEAWLELAATEERMPPRFAYGIESIRRAPGTGKSERSMFFWNLAETCWQMRHVAYRTFSLADPGTVYPKSIVKCEDVWTA